MAAPVGQLAVRLTAETGDFRRKLDSAQQSVGRLGREMRGAINAAAKYGAAIAGVGVAVGTKLVAQQLKAVDALAKTSDKLGIATQDLAAMRHAAELTGVSANTLDMALQRMTRRVAEAGIGTGEAKDALIELGINAQNLARLSPDKQFQAIAGAMENVATQGDRVRLAMKLFDSEGVSLVNTLALGEQGLKDMREEADRLGISVSRLEAAQIEAANDALTRAGAVMGGVVRRATVDLAPVIEAVANEFANAASNATDFGQSSINAARMVVKPFGVILDGLHGIQVALKGAETFFAGMAFGAVSSINDVGQAIIRLGNIIPGVTIDGDANIFAQLEVAATETLTRLQGELHALAMQPIPSQQIDAFLTRIQEASAIAAEQVAINREQMLSDFEIDEALTQDHNNKLTAIEQRAADARKRVAEQEARDKKNAQNQFFTDMTSLMNTESRKLFEVGKAAAIANTIISTYESAQDAFKFGTKIGGPPVGAAFAAAAIGAGFARVQAIRSTSFGAGAGGSAAAGGNGAVSAAPTSAQTGAVEQSPRRVFVEGIDPGSMFSGRQLIEILNEAQQDGPALITVAR